MHLNELLEDVLILVLTGDGLGGFMLWAIDEDLDVLILVLTGDGLGAAWFVDYLTANY